MGRYSVKEEKNVYQKVREECGLTREQAYDVTGVSDDKIEKIENRGVVPFPDEVLQLSAGYKKASLCNYYCANQCPIGRKYVPEIKTSDLQQIVVELSVYLNSIQDKRNRLLEISIDKTVDDDQVEDFINIKKELDRISALVDTLEIWSEDMLSAGKINRGLYEKYNNQTD